MDFNLGNAFEFRLQLFLDGGGDRGGVIGGCLRRNLDVDVNLRGID